MINLGSSKYKGLLITISFFLVFFILVGIFNVYLAKSVNSENSRLNELTKINVEIVQTDTSTSDQKWNRLASDLTALHQGGEVSDITFSEVNKQIDTSLFAQAASGIKELISPDDFSSQKSALLATLANLETQWIGVIESKNKRFEILQLASIILAVIYFAGIVFQMVRNFDNIDSEIEIVKGETENILSTVNEGLFLITPDFEIGAQQSQALSGIFGMKENIEGNFFDFLNKYVSENSLEIAKDFLGLLFGKRVKEKLIDDLNPLKRVQINLERRDGSFETHYINFDFKRVLENKEVKYILGSATDVTQEVLLELELEETKTQSEAQIDLFLSVLHVPPKQLKLFVNDTSVGLNHINSILMETGNKDYKDKILNISRVVHKIKGDAALLNLHSFEVKAHDFEEVISEVSANPSLSGEDLLPLVIQLKNMISHKDSFLSVFEKFDASKSELGKIGFNSKDPQPDANIDQQKNQVQQMVERISKEYGKQASVTEYHDIQSDFSKNELKPIEDCMIQLVRNAVAHGIESPKTRTASGKSVMGNIHISTTETNEGIELVVKDDGAGIDIDAIRHKAVENSLFDQDEIENMSDKQIAALIFRPNLSSKESADLNSGRGVGLSLVKEIVQQFNSKVGLKWMPKKYTVFKIVFPKNRLSQQEEQEYKAS